MFVCADTYMPPFTFTCRDQRTQGPSCCFGMWTLNSGCLIHHIPRFPSILYCSFSITLLTRHLHKQRDAENIPEVCQVLKLRFLCHRNKQTSHWQEKKMCVFPWLLRWLIKISLNLVRMTSKFRSETAILLAWTYWWKQNQADLGCPNQAKDSKTTRQDIQRI